MGDNNGGRSRRNDGKGRTAGRQSNSIQVCATNGRGVVKRRPRAGAWISRSRVWHRLWQTPFLFERYGIQSTGRNGSGWHRGLGSQARVRSPVSLHAEQHGKVLGRRKVFSVRAFRHKFRVCGGGRSPLSQK